MNFYSGLWSTTVESEKYGEDSKYNNTEKSYSYVLYLSEKYLIKIRVWGWGE